MASANNFYGSAPTNRKAPPPPQARPGAATTTRRNVASRAKPAYQSARATAPPRPSGTSTTTTATSKTGPTRAKASSSTTRTSMSGTRKAPVPSRPVGSYYNSSVVATSNDGMNSGVSSASPYASSVPPATPTTGTSDRNDNDTWDDWGSPDAKSSVAATQNSHSSWAAPAPAASANDWYSTGGSGSNASAAPTGYTSAGFGNQPSQQQQQAPMQPGTGFYQTANAQQQQQQAPMQPGSGFYQNTNAQQQQQPFLSGAMDSSAPMMSAANTNAGMANANSNATPNIMPSFSMFMPSAGTQQQPEGPTDSYPSIEDEAPLLEELGINIQHMMLKTKAVVLPFSRFGGDQIDPHVICQDGEMAGPVVLLLMLGGEMVLTGKLQFGYIYVYGLFGCIAMTFVVNLISPTDAVSFWAVTSIMGYALLPVNILALVKIFVVNLINLQTLGNILGALTVLWSTLASTRLLEQGCGLRDQRYLIMYPLLLFYSAFVMMTIL